ncbi:iron dicitrate transport regulator FecR [Haloferula helveola]|uniref:Iron dicitrate transport regulator FecR n=1 Tax=Haloferula helveola TaxID=490095 RepID=A0ABM7RJ31_9BACT|nr:iron dicitrate transport regulator FecR [Haloferula helveola]
MKAIPVLLLLIGSAAADTLQSAKVTQAVNDVKVYTNSKSPRAASIGETIRGANSLTTGRKSRAELAFQDNTITRLGQNSVFRFRDGSRDVELQQGSVLLQVPKSAGGATIRTATVTAAITGTTSMFEYSPGEWVKLLTLEGTQKLLIKGQKNPVLVPAGQMIVMHPNARVIPQPVTVDLAKLLATSQLAGDKVFGPLPQAAQIAIAKTVEQQKQAKRDGTLLPTRDVISGPGVRGGGKQRDVRQPRNPPTPPREPTNPDFPGNDNRG